MKLEISTISSYNAIVSSCKSTLGQLILKSKSIQLMLRSALMITLNSDRKNSVNLKRTHLLLKILILIKIWLLLLDSTMLLSMEISDAWSMVPDLLWLPWISSNLREDSLPTSWMLEEVQMANKSKLPSKSFPLTQKSKLS